MRWVVLIGLGVAMWILFWDMAAGGERAPIDEAKQAVFLILLIIFFVALAVWFPSNE